MSDYLIRATAADGMIRAFAATTRDTVEHARQTHNSSPVVTAALGRLLTAGAMMGSMMKGENDLLTLQIRGDGPMQGMVVTADPRGNVKGYAFEPEVLIPGRLDGKLDVAGAVGLGYLNVIMDLGLKDPYSSRVDLISGEIAEDLTYYFATSEQTPSSVGLGVHMTLENTVQQAGGFIVQLMPGATEEIIAALESKLSGMSSVTEMLEQGMTCENILEFLLGDFGLEINERMPVRFFCNCSRDRVRGVLAGLGRKDLQEMIDEEDVEVNCHFCSEKYSFSPAELTEILEGRA
ncbi:Hsp33 family molecular chaperone HslO [Parasporobacterium paucivorans]|uniref:33 kDa chaperonin n=1 Tax=Parasporobacterium paucivorans DSM 15970 TaxID=1122934 RepID=A0A1M6H9C3_9FIRM|nr:Hsp33 family molecular chaperone HslO [Parasporobacterium paucivorans]SHJ18683.1 molecular chaperone Hsp33 [Parasporobacterium paucivorans DSM 15970]